MSQRCHPERSQGVQSVCRTNEKARVRINARVIALIRGVHAPPALVAAPLRQALSRLPF
jgi:hypothetical protein